MDASQTIQLIQCASDTGDGNAMDNMEEVIQRDADVVYKDPKRVLILYQSAISETNYLSHVQLGLDARAWNELCIERTSKC